MTFVDGAWLGVLVLVIAGILSRIVIANRSVREKKEWEILDNARLDFEAASSIDELLDIRKWLNDNKTKLLTVELQSACIRLMIRVEKKLDYLSTK